MTPQKENLIVDIITLFSVIVIFTALIIIISSL
jgi:hypothetical protein